MWLPFHCSDQLHLTKRRFLTLARVSIIKRTVDWNCRGRQGREGCGHTSSMRRGCFHWKLAPRTRAKARAAPKRAWLQTILRHRLDARADGLRQRLICARSWHVCAGPGWSCFRPYQCHSLIKAWRAGGTLVQNWNELGATLILHLGYSTKRKG